MKASVKGAVQSKTMWVAAAVILVSQIAPAVPQICATLNLNASTTQTVGTIMGLVMAALRTLTTQSLADKGASNVNPPAGS